ncbi:MAG: HEAT repeat domain-containing protein [Melioribacteraceae bacterium]|nr:HEAT repeat domain-containing protein [Melioribacteraceae bacterium]
MKHDRIKELIDNYLIEEITPDELTELENHIFECAECSAYFDEMKKLSAAIRGSKPEPVADEFLDQARNELYDRLRTLNNTNRSKHSLFEKAKELFGNNYKIALSSAFTLVLGFIIGYAIFFTPSGERKDSLFASEIDLDNLDKSKISVEKISYPSITDQTGEIEVAFEASTPVVYRGSFEDKLIQELIAQSIVNSKNPGIKIETLTRVIDNPQIVDDKVKNALITALKKDENDGVRRQALIGLANFQYDDDIKEALLFALNNDSNAGIKILAINTLTNFKQSGVSFDDKTLKQLDESSRTDENNLIRIKASNLLMGELK